MTLPSSTTSSIPDTQEATGAATEGSPIDSDVRSLDKNTNNEEPDTLSLLSTEESDEEETPDESLSVTIVQEIDEGSYICLVCTCEIDRHSKIWSCENCYRVYDLECIRDWAIRGSSTTERKKWRCPACNIEHSKLPSKFTCWCGRLTNPSSDSFIPFSCGNPCNVKYPDCVHPCSSLCHPGKHPACGALGPVMPCHCGKHTRQLPCLATPYKTGWLCDAPCETPVCELGHKCPIGKCHLGFCGICKELVNTRCYCGQENIAVQCLKIVPKICKEKDARDSLFVGGVACNNISIEYYDCGVHFEELDCQPLPSKTRECKYAPKNVTSCYCGKTPAESLNRKNCTDPMPECDQVCGKLLKCGCTCLAKCHQGPCECFNIIETKCSCENSSYLVPCKALQQGFRPKCHHKCTATLSCRRHTHREECCEFEQVALRRERETRKHFRNRTRANFEDQILTMEPIHICTRTCNLLKLCEKHHCQALCHSGSCGECLESSSEDLVCHCGKTVIPAPVRCGTKIECHEQCTRETPCGHRPEIHNCHGDDVACPKCTYLVTKSCNCGERELKNVLCSVQSVSCGKICNAKKSCGHPCNRACNKDCTRGIHADILDCQSKCHKIRKNCPHLCAARCHSGKGTSCDALKCKAPVVITCSCGRLTKNVVCGADENEKSRIGSFFSCDEECAQIKREKELSKIFNVSSQEDDYSYPASVLNVFRRQNAWCLKMEATIRNFVSDYQDSVAANLKPNKSLHFPPMSKPQRTFIHELAEVYKLYSESQDKEPLRSVFICITELTSSPTLTIMEVIQKQDDAERKRQQLEELKSAQIEQSLFNAIIVSDVFFGVKREDLEASISEILKSYPEVTSWQLQWIKESTFVFHHQDYQAMDKEKEDRLYILLKTFKKIFRDKLLAFDCKMCLVTEGADYILKTDLTNVTVTQQIEQVPAPSHNAFEVLQQKVES